MLGKPLMDWLVLIASRGPVVAIAGVNLILYHVVNSCGPDKSPISTTTGWAPQPLMSTL
jgi:hypothetical protein